MLEPHRPVDSSAILESLRVVEQERNRRSGDAGLAARVDAIKAYQEARFRHTYADLLLHRRYGAASRFFLEELYGPRDFTRRDAQFARVVPALVRLFPREVVGTVATLGALHALSETLDSAMGAALADGFVDAARYAVAWQTVGRREDRCAQIELTLEVGRSLDRYTSVPMLALSLRMMRGAARAAGLSELQAFLERGFDTFKAMRGAGEFLGLVEQREKLLLLELFDDPQAVVVSGRLP
ncbi:MAG TPA: hypothetical protein VJM48_12150 [Methylibium sp.]|nr:hypothetical protein [Methylibium sp.]